MSTLQVPTYCHSFLRHDLTSAIPRTIFYLPLALKTLIHAVISSKHLQIVERPGT